MLVDTIIANLLIPLGLMAWLWFDQDQRKIDWLLKAGICGAVVMLCFLAGTWQELSYALRYILAALFLIVAYLSYRRVREHPFWHESAGGRLVTYISVIALSALALYNVDVLRGFWYTGEPITLAFPLRGGIYYVTEGGTHVLLNGHIVTNGTPYALDIEALNGLGRHSRGFFPSRVTDYEIYGATLYSPCAGQVVETMNVIPDSPVNELYKASRAMNQVVLQCGDVRVLMGHLLQGSVTVQKEDRVQAGQPLGKVGNSGKSKRPHLHIQADRSSGQFDAVPILFDGVFLVRNSIVVR